MCTLNLQLMDSQLLFHTRQEASQYELPRLVQQWCQSLGFRMRSRTRVFSTQRSNCSPSVVRIWSNFVRFSWIQYDFGGKPFHMIVPDESDRSILRSSGLFLASCFQWLSLEKTARPFSSSVKPNCSHQFATAPQTLS